MTRKILTIGIALIIFFSLGACNSGNLAEYKTTAKAEIETYAQERQSNYSEDNWTIVCGIVMTGKDRVEVSTNKKQVKAAVTTAREEIDTVSRKLIGLPESSGEPAPLIWTRFASDESRIKVGEDLNIKFYYASLCDFISISDPAPISVSAKIIMGHSVHGNINQYGSYSSTLIDEFVLKEIDNFADVVNYPVAGSISTAFEEIVIPADWFVGEKGSIGWSVKAELIWAEETGKESETHGGGVALYYRVEGENIILYNSYYKFYNDICN